MKELKQYLQNKKVLYIHGLNSSSNSLTGKQIKEYLGDKMNIFIPTWDLTKVGVDKDIKKYIAKNNISIVIASSLGAFYALTITDSVAKILINPCLHPSVEIPKLETLTAEQIEYFRNLEKQIKDNTDSEMRMCTFAGFGDKDTLFNYQKEFKHEFGNMVVVPGSHKLPEKSLYKVLEVGFEYFNKIQNILFEELIQEHFTNLFRGDDFSKWQEQAYDLLNKVYAPIGGLLGVPNSDKLVEDSDMWKMYTRNGKILAICTYTFKRTGRKLTACGAVKDNNGHTDPEAKKWLYKILSDDMSRRNGWVEVDDKMAHIMKKCGGIPVPSDIAEILMKGKTFTYKDPDGYHYRRIIGGEEHTKILYANPNGEQIHANTVNMK